MLSVSYAGKNVNSAGKTSGVLRGGASETDRGGSVPPFRGWQVNTVFSIFKEATEGKSSIGFGVGMG